MVINNISELSLENKMSLPSGLVDGPPVKSKTLIAAFEKELAYLNSYVRKNKHEDRFIQKGSNSLFSLWNEYETKLPSPYFTRQQLALGDVLYERRLYSLARTHCYGRYLQIHYDSSVPLSDAVAALSDPQDIVALLRALIGDAMCQYHTVLQADNKMMYVSSRRTARKVLECLQSVCQAALSREPLYWIVHNTLLLTYSICRHLMAYSTLVLEHLIWAAVAMESSVPLMASKYLRMRVNFYTAACSCYYSLKQPLEAELFARRGLDKVHELAQLEGARTTQELAYQEASLKLGVIIFKQSVFVSRKKLRPGFRPKVRPSLHELLQASPPRSPTEKLAGEMFSGSSAIYMAVLETLVDTSRRPLTKGPPTVPEGTELDQETVNDIYQELFCVGLDISLRALDRPIESGSLLTNAVRREHKVPLEALVTFVRVCYSADQREVVDLMAVRLIQETQVSDIPAVKALGKSLELLLMVDSLTRLYKRYKSSQPGTAPPSLPATLPTSLTELREDCTTAEDLFSKLQDTLSLLHLNVGDELLLATDFDLLLDAGVLIWEVVRPAFSLISSHDVSACKQFLSHSTGSQYVVFLAQLVDVFHALELWRVDPILQGELCLKLASLYEAKATLKTTSRQLEGFVLLYDRKLLLECLAQLERDVRCVEVARECMDGRNLETLHAQFLMAMTRVKVKLASTIPPPCPSEGTQKPSSLKSKVAERNERSLQRARMLSVLTAPTVPVLSIADLRAKCHASSYKRAVLCVLQASLDPQLDHKAKTVLLEEAHSCLSKETPLSTHPSPRHILPPPRLLYTTDTSMSFTPIPFADEDLKSQVCYYRLYGRPAAGSNVRVRLSDHNLSGLGLEVSLGECLCVQELEINVEYVFAVAAYSANGELVGGSIGATGTPILASYTYPPLAVWGELCQAAYVCGAQSLAERAADRLWRELTPSGVQSSHHPSTLRLLVQSILIQTQLALSQGKLYPDILRTTEPLRDKQLSRLKLAERLMTALDVSAMLNDGPLCLQVAVMVYGVLAPLVQHTIQSRALVGLLLRCYAVIGEVPEALHKRSSSLHHMIAGIGYYLSKIANEDGEKGLFSLITDNVRSLLIASMPTGTKPSDPARPEGLQQASLLSGSFQQSSETATIISSGLPSLLPQPSNKRRKNRCKKLTAGIDEISDESKSAAYKAFEGFLLSRVPHTLSEDFDLTGQEDPVILHAIIATHTSSTAYREVHRFRRRPQYLEYFVHLATATLSKGHTEKVLEWCYETFSWLSRRNNLLLSTKSIVSTKTKHEPHKLNKPSIKMPRTMSTMGSSLNVSNGRNTVASSLNLPTAKKLTKQTSNHISTISSNLNVNEHVPKERLAFGSPGRQALKRRHKKISLAPGKMKRFQAAKVLDMEAKITRDDLKAKAFTVMTLLLPYVWKTHRARKRLRSVCELERPWRTQANIIQATCHLERLEKRLAVLSVPGGQPVGPTFDSAGVIVEGVVPVYNKALAGANDEVTERENILPSLAPILAELEALMFCYTRAVTLAHRGAHWILLMNCVHSLLNAITCLLGTVGGVSTDGLLAAVYGEALRPLYCSVIGLLDLLLNSGVGCCLPDAMPLKTSQEDCEEVCLVRRAVFLTAHVLYVHEHWEKVVSIIIKFNDITNHSWWEQLSPVLSAAQTKLSQRLAAHKDDLKRTRIHPAAHLDPGPDGYNLYGGVGHSLGLSLVPTADSNDCRQVHSGHGGKLRKARSLRSQYMAQIVCIGDVVEAYNNALEEVPDSDLLAQAMNELGDLLLFTNASSQWWVESLCLLLGVRDPLTNWRDCLNTVLNSAGIWGCLLAGQIAYKLARYVHDQELDVRLEYTLLAASLFKIALSYSLPTPTSDLSFISYQCEVFPGVEVFNDEQRISAPSLLAALSWTAQELTSRQHALSALPVLWLYAHVAVSVCRDNRHTVLAKLLRLQALTQLHKFSEALMTLSELLVGSGLPQTIGGADKQSDIYWVFCGFSTSFHLTDAKNLKCLQGLVDRDLSPQLVELYGPVNVQLLSLLRAQLYTTLAQCLSPLHHTPVVGRIGDQHTETMRSSTSLTKGAHSGSTLSLGSTPGTSQIMLPSSVPRQHDFSDIKHTLLDCVKQFLTLSEGPRCLLELSRVADIYYQRSTAIGLSLAAVRRLQCKEEVFDPRLWLEALSTLAHCLIGHSSSNGLSCEEVCSTGGEQAEALGDYELAARFSHTAALHGLSMMPQDLAVITKHCQRALELLEHPSELSSLSSLLRCEVTLLLADVSCVPGVSHVPGVPGVSGVDMVEVFRGLVGMLKEQLVAMDTEPDHPNLFLPHRALLAATNLRLSHCLVHSADSALVACEEGLLMLKQSSLSDPCLLAELLVQKGWLLSLSNGSAGVKTFAEAVCVIAEAGIDSKLAVSTLYKLCELTSSKTIISRSPSPLLPVKKRSDTKASRKSRDGTSRSTGKQVHNSWLFLKLGSKADRYLEILDAYISQVSNEEATKPLSPKMLADLPDFLLLDLCATEELTTQLAYSMKLPPIESLLPSSQVVLTTGLTLLKIAGYLRQLLNQCFWQKTSLGLSSSNWCVHSHPLTRHLYPRAKALVDFLTTHSHQLKALKIPTIPGSKATPEPLVIAVECELTIVWTTTFPPDASSNTVVGYFAFNAKSIRASSHAHSQGVKCHVIKTSLSALEEAALLWAELGALTTGYFDNRTRPISRSPSKQKKSERGVKMPPEVREASSQAVEALKTILQVSSETCPPLELPIVSKVPSLLKPYTQSTVRGELYHFFKALFDSNTI